MTSIENTSRIEPAMLEAIPADITDLVAELSKAGAVLGSAFHPTTAANLAALVRTMNTYYSNLIEGHHTRPLDIERALAGDFDRENKQRNLQLEAAAHARVQAEIDRKAAEGALAEPASAEFIRGLHREFYRNAPQEFLRIRSAGGADCTEFQMTPGEWRNLPQHDNVVGRHIPPSSERVNDFMRYFQDRYRFENLGMAAKILATAAAHHRFTYIHPFPDGNGRVSRLMSHAMALQAGIGAHGLWSISRGLARGLESRAEYKRNLEHADTPRQGDLDGRGNLSQRALSEWTLWFLQVCLDQINFMAKLFDPDDLSRRLRAFVERRDTLKPEASKLLEEALHRGQFDRGEAGRITGLPTRSAQRVLNGLTAEGLLTSQTPKGPVSLRFPAATLEELFPKLYSQM